MDPFTARGQHRSRSISNSVDSRGPDHAGWGGEFDDLCEKLLTDQRSSPSTGAGL